MKKRAAKFFNNKTSIILLALIVIVIFFSIASPGYLSKSNLLIFFKSVSVMGIISIGIGCLLIGGQVDLGASNSTVLCGVIVAMLLEAKVAWPFAVIITLLLGVVIGVIISFFVIKLGMMAFIATIGLSSVWQGVALLLTRATPIMITNKFFKFIGNTAVFGFIPISLLILIFLLIIYYILLTQTRLGRQIYMCGGNANSARLAGINPNKISFILFINNCLMCSLAGILYTANMRNGDPASITFGMDAITAAVIGGIAFTGGSGGIGGLAVGIFFMNAFTNGMTSIGVASYWQIFLKGFLLCVALTLDYSRERTREKAIVAHAKAIRHENKMKTTSVGGE